MPAFVVWMTHFLSPAIAKPASVVVIAIMLAVALRCRDPRRDVVVFIAGSSLGVFLEYWGTSRECWTYYTRETPPAVAVLAHGFAAVAFARVARRGRRGVRPSDVLAVLAEERRLSPAHSQSRKTLA